MKIATKYIRLVLVLSVIAISTSAHLFLKKTDDSLERRYKRRRQDNATNSTASNSSGAAAGSAGSGNSSSNSSSNSTPPSCPSAAFQDEAPAPAFPKKEPYGASTNVYGKNVNATNAAGQVGNRTLSLDKAPWRMKTCDQVLQISAQRLKDFNDYSVREPAFFTLSIYMINMFSGKDNTRLVESVNIENIANVPDIVQGSKSCLDFNDVKNQKRITMCLDDMDRVDDIKEAFQKIMRCRMGDNLKEIPIQTIKKIFAASCLGMNVEFSSKMAASTNNFLASMNLRNQLAGSLAKAGAQITSNNPWEVKYMTPVPGS